MKKILNLKNFEFFLFRKFAAGVVDTGGNLPLASLTTVANLPLVSTTLAKLVAKFAISDVDLHLDFRISPRIFEKIRNDPKGILWVWGETDS